MSSDAFERYVIPEIPVMLRVARSLTRNDADAEDLVQDSLLRAHQAIDRFDGRYPRAWLLTIVRNTHINRNRRRRPQLLADADGGTERLERIADDRPADAPDAGVEASFDAEVERALEALPENFRAVVDLVDVGGLSYQEAAHVLDIPEGTVMSRLHRARTRMREQLQRVGIAPGPEDDPR
jgi:RNA polymerase sigma-70 factor (ECF subfamily)